MDLENPEKFLRWKSVSEGIIFRPNTEKRTSPWALSTNQRFNIFKFFASDTSLPFVKVLIQACKLSHHDKLAHFLAVLAIPRGYGRSLVTAAAELEFQSVLSKNAQKTLFRSDTIATKLFTYFSRMSSSYWFVSILGKILLQIQSDADSGKILKKTVPDDWVASLDNATIDYIKGKIRAMIDIVILHFFSLPTCLINTLKELYNILVMAQCESPAMIIGSIIFLRFITYGITNPNLFGIYSEPPSLKTRKILTTIGKVLQFFANSIIPSTKQKELEPFDCIVKEYLPRAIECYTVMLSPIFNKAGADDYQRFLLPPLSVSESELDSLLEYCGIYAHDILTLSGDNLPECFEFIKQINVNPSSMLSNSPQRGIQYRKNTLKQEELNSYQRGKQVLPTQSPQKLHLQYGQTDLPLGEYDNSLPQNVVQSRSSDHFSNFSPPQQLQLPLQQQHIQPQLQNQLQQQQQIQPQQQPPPSYEEHYNKHSEHQSQSYTVAQTHTNSDNSIIPNRSEYSSASFSPQMSAEKEHKEHTDLAANNDQEKTLEDLNTKITRAKAKLKKVQGKVRDKEKQLAKLRDEIETLRLEKRILNGENVSIDLFPNECKRTGSRKGSHSTNRQKHDTIGSVEGDQ